MLRRKALAIVTREVKTRLVVPKGGDGGVDAETLFDDGESIRKLIEKLRLRSKDG